jgi:pullulanase/glycogen debranching enzyme
MYSAQLNIPPGSYEFKIAQDGSMDTSWGIDGDATGANMTFTVAGDGATYFVYDPVSHRAVASQSDGLVTLPGSYQTHVGCSGNWSVNCLWTVMFPTSDGTYVASTNKLPAGNWEAKVAHALGWDINYGQGGVAGGSNYQFSTTANENVTFIYTPTDHLLTIEQDNPPLAGVGKLWALWLDRSTIAWPSNLSGDPATMTFQLAGYPDLSLTASGLVTAAQAEADPRAAGYTALTLADATGEALDSATLDAIVSGPLEVLGTRNGKLVAQTGIQIAGVLDDLYADAANETLGVTWEQGVPTLKLWAPTAQNVDLLVWEDGPEGSATAVPADRSDNGTWAVTGSSAWKNTQYKWAVDVYVTTAGEVVTNTVTDPYSVALTTDSTHSVMIDLEDPTWMPTVWVETPIPEALRTQAQQTIYELHVRDFSAADQSVPEALRGTYKAFTLEDSDGMQHLAELAEAGMTTVHLLPTYDIATIPELAEDRTEPVIPTNAAANSTAQWSAIRAVSGVDAFNWGYDPWHWTTPEGSYATPDAQSGGARTSQFREMVAGLHQLGLRVVLDVVYNHTSQAGQSSKCVLDRVVPGYYQRLSADGTIATSTCCPGVATENTMAGKMMVDSVVTWAKAYHVDGFRFDIMGHHSLENMQDVRAALDQLTIEDDGVDGEAIYVYGEAWNFGEVQDDGLFVQARQANIGGTGIGAFNDRLRDGVRGGGVSDSDMRTYQGFGTGLYTDRNAATSQTSAQQLDDLYYRTNLVRLGLMGNLEDFMAPDSDGAGDTVRAGDLAYGDQAAAYAEEPQESVNYADAHDNETLFDISVWKLPASATLDTRVRMNTLSLAAVTLGQSPAFWHAGVDILRSKSLDSNSYNSGDHFNAIDWSLSTNVFGTGMPQSASSTTARNRASTYLTNTAIKPTSAAMEQAYQQSLDLLRLRSSTPLFTLGTAELIMERVTFPNAGPNPTPGLLVMSIVDPATGTTDIDPALDEVLVVFNASPDAITEAIDDKAGLEFELHPVQMQGSDTTVQSTSWNTASGTVTVPGRTVAVLVRTPNDTEAPDAPAMATSINGAQYRSTTPSFWGTAEPGSSVRVTTVSAPVTILCRGTANEAGAWSCSPSAELAEGEYRVSARAKDAAGNESGPSVSRSFAIDVTPPASPVITKPANSAAVGAPHQFSGTAEAGTTVRLTEGSTIHCTGVADTSGTWSCTPAVQLTEGTHKVSARAKDTAGNESGASLSKTFTVDVSAPSKPTLTRPTNNAVTTGTVTFTGLAEAGARVRVSTTSAPVTVLCTGYADATGSWSCQASALAPGQYQVSARAKDAVGNESSASTSRTFMVVV